MTILEIQRALKARGHDPGPLDGAWGRRTIAALTAFQTAAGLRPDGVLGPITLSRLDGSLGVPGAGRPPGERLVGAVPPPWFAEAGRLLGVREIAGAASNPVILGWTRRLSAWVRGFYTADSIPWCGLFQGHCVGLTLPAEPLPGNPLSAQAWAAFGVPLAAPSPGAILVFTRAGGGHVGQYVAERADAYLVRGGNQSDAVTEAWIAKSRCTAIRWPATWPLPTTGRVLHDVAGALSTDER